MQGSINAAILRTIIWFSSITNGYTYVYFTIPSSKVLFYLSLKT